MKLSVSVSAQEVVVLDEYARTAGLRSRSAAIQHAIRLLRDSRLDQEYASAFDEWDASVDSVAWDSASGDGLVDASR